MAGGYGQRTRSPMADDGALPAASSVRLRGTPRLLSIVRAKPAVLFKLAWPVRAKPRCIFPGPFSRLAPDPRSLFFKLN